MTRKPSPLKSLIVPTPEESLMPRIIEVVVSPKGETTIQTKGYAGSDCLKASKFLEQALGIPVNERKTSEFYETTEIAQHQENQL